LAAEIVDGDLETIMESVPHELWTPQEREHGDARRPGRYPAPTPR
jgi:hypothetical protein